MRQLAAPKKFAAFARLPSLSRLGRLVLRLIRGFIARHRWAGAHQVSVAIDIVDPSDRGPVFRAFGLAIRNGGQLSGVAQAGLGEDVLEGMGCVFQGVIARIPFPGADF